MTAKTEPLPSLPRLIFVTGIDTDAGKSYATGWLARSLMDNGKRVATLKLVQTGCTDASEDIEVHRRIMGTTLPEDATLVTAPQIFTYPASPHLATEIDKRELDFGRIESCVRQLAGAYDVLLIEGAGGPMVPLTRSLLTIDYAAVRHWPVALVTNGRLGSISHTLLALEAIERRGMQLAAVLYNTHFDGADPLIAADTRHYLEDYVAARYPATPFLTVPTLPH